jgi:hypothetical protein
MMRNCAVARITGKSALALVSLIWTSLGPVALTDSNWSATTLTLEAVAGSLWRMIE